jgi:hypothetical protein
MNRTGTKNRIQGGLLSIRAKEDKVKNSPENNPRIKPIAVKIVQYRQQPIAKSPQPDQ